MSQVDNNRDIVIKRQGGVFLTAMLVCLDALFLVVSWLCAYWLRIALAYYYPLQLNPFEDYLVATPMMVLGWIITGGIFGLYRRTAKMSITNEFIILVKVFFLGLLVSMSLGFLLRDLHISRSVVIFMGVLSFFFLSVSRIIVRMVESVLWRRGYGVLRTLVVGAGESGIRTVQKLQDSWDVGYRIIGFVDNDHSKIGTSVGDIPVLGSDQDIHTIIDEYHIDDVFFALPNLDHHTILNIVSASSRRGVSFHIVTDVFDVISDATRIDMVGNFPVVNLKGEGPGRGYDFFKRAMDIVIASIGIMITVPLWLFVMAFIKIDSRGPIFFSQERVGRDGKRFSMIKFRTMRVDTPNYSRSPRKERDDRVTRLGRILRRLSLDELPQLINVLEGDMSIVGPRPEMPFIVEKYQEWEKKRLSVKPGLTGLWQVIGRQELPLEENVQYDFYYIKNRSLIMDISIVLRTIPALLSRKGAY